jgi:uncharacterized protein YjbI with pentapeptide repeats
VLGAETHACQTRNSRTPGPAVITFITARPGVHPVAGTGGRDGRAGLAKERLSDANLGLANLHLAKLKGANLYHANLYDANLTNANLKGANLNKAYLEDADLSGATWIDGSVCRQGSIGLCIT